MSGLFMPLYMDKHYLLGATAEAVSRAHMADLDNQAKYSCRAITYWFDENSGEAFCLIEAPDKNSVEELHRKSHGFIPNQVIEVDSNLVNLFLGRISDPPKDKNLDQSEFIIKESGSRTILYIDFKYESLINLSLGDENYFEILNIRNDMIRELLLTHNGREVLENTEGGFMSSFMNASDSVDCALEIQKFVKDHNNSNPKIRFNVGMGLCLGNPVSEKEGLFSESIQIAKNLCYNSNNDKIMVSSSISEVFKEENLKYFKEKNLKILNSLDESFLIEVMQKIVKLWNKEDLNIDLFSNNLGVSKSQLYRKITALTGLSPKEFINNYKLIRSMKMIERKQGNIAEIAFASGYNSPSYFSKCFEKRFGILPSVYANRII